MDDKEREPGYSTIVNYVRAIDGDTIEFEIRRTFNIRLRDIDVYEKNTELGKEATCFVDNLLSNAKRILIFVPSNDPIRLMDFNSFERIVGDIIVDNKHLGEILKENGYEKD